MKSIKNLLLISLMIFILAGCGKENDKKLILESFNNYKSSIINKDGIAAYSLIDSNTKQFYNKIINKIYYATETETKNMPIREKLIVTLARHSIDKETLKKMDGKSLFIYAVDNGWINKDSTSRLKITISDINKNTAHSRLVTSEGESDFGFTFYKENKKWLIDLNSTAKGTEKILKREMSKHGATETEVIYSTIKYVTGKKPDESIWQPVK